MSHWRLGLPTRKGRYIWALLCNRADEPQPRFGIMEGNFDPAIQKHPFELHDWAHTLVAWKPMPTLQLPRLAQMISAEVKRREKTGEAYPKWWRDVLEGTWNNQIPGPVEEHILPVVSGLETT